MPISQVYTYTQLRTFYVILVLLSWNFTNAFEKDEIVKPIETWTKNRTSFSSTDLIWTIYRKTDRQFFLYMDDYLRASYRFSAIGIPLNLAVIFLIVGLKLLHLHCIFTWLGVFFANLSLLLCHFFELQAVICMGSDTQE